jgi:hypothetical protein
MQIFAWIFPLLPSPWINRDEALLKMPLARFHCLCALLK